MRNTQDKLIPSFINELGLGLSEILGDTLIKMMILYLILINIIPQVNRMAGNSNLVALITSVFLVLLCLSWCASLLREVGLIDDGEDDQEDDKDKQKEVEKEYD